MISDYLDEVIPFVTKEGIESLAAAINAKYATAGEAYVDLYPAFDDFLLGPVEEEEAVSEEEIEEPYGFGFLREVFVKCLEDGTELTIGELAFGALLFSSERRNTDYELDQEDLGSDNCYLRLPAAALKRFYATESQEEKTLLLLAIDGLLDIVQRQIGDYLKVVGDDGTFDIILTQDAINETVAGLADPRVAEIVGKGRETGAFPFMAIHTFTSGDSWRILMRDARHPTEPVVDEYVLNKHNPAEA
jgi:hypothetical protein